jgi:putative nucleotidyltransferase with HDIG domain
MQPITACRFRTEDAITTIAPRLDQTDSSLTDVVRALFAALHAKDPATCSHSARVALIAVMLCDQMRLDPQIRAIVSSAGILHDIGKIGIPDAILRKPGPLAPDEADLMKTHAVVGWTLCSQFRFLQQEAIAIRHHHERVDGSGYPDGLRATTIPLPARILAVADAYDAIITGRPYRPAKSHDQALAALRRGAGAQFDPDAVAAFLHLSLPAPPAGLSAAVLTPIAPPPAAR